MTFNFSTNQPEAPNSQLHNNNRCTDSGHAEAMNSIRTIQELNKRELENNVSTSASWHTDYRDTAYIYIGGLPLDLSEGDVVTIFSQYGEPTYINLVRDKESGKSRGFAFLKYEDQRSCDLAVDNMGGATVMGRVLKVDHTRYKRKDEEAEEERERMLRGLEAQGEESEEEVPQRALLKEEVELRKLMQEHDEDDPMKEYLVKEKKEEVARALATLEDGEGGKRKHGHRHHRHHRKAEREKEGEEKRRGKERREEYGEEEKEKRRHKHHHSHRRRSRSR